MNVINKKLVGCFIVVILLLSFVATAQPLAAQKNYTNITPKQANQIINSLSSANVVVLDVRNESECKFAHLYNSLNIPVYALEAAIDYYTALPNATIIDYRSVILMQHINDPVIVYCEKGGRSAIAANILVEKGFTKVYNVIGGIDAWAQTDLPFYNTAHNITVSQTKTTIEPWTSFPCACERQTNGDSNEDNVITNRVLDITDETENCSQGTFSFEYDGTTYDTNVSATSLWTYENSDCYGTNVTATFELLESSGDISLRDYLLRYQIQHVDYNFSVTTTLQPLDANTYNASVTVVRFAPIGKEDWLSVEKVVFTSPVTLTKLYAGLEKICKDLAQTYKKDGSKHNDAVLNDLAVNYGLMADGLKDLSKLVHSELRSYDLEILRSEAILVDDFCALCVAVATALISVITCGIIDFFFLGGLCIGLGFVTTAGVATIPCLLVAGLLVDLICGGLIGLGAWALCAQLDYCGIYYVDYCYVSEINNGYGINKDNVIGMPDSHYAILTGGFFGDGAHLVCHLEEKSSGGLRATIRTFDSQMVWIYVSEYNNNDWRLIYRSWPSSQEIHASTSDPYNYVSIVAYDMYFVSIPDLWVDAIAANY
jgi:rhodanese-related sulfurtransferase